MKTLKLLGWSGAAVCLLAACSAEESLPPVPAGGNTIEVSTYVNPGKRVASKSTFKDGDAISLYACQTTGDYVNVFGANFMDNVVVTHTSGSWTYSPLSSWPTDAGEHLSFVAYYPQNTSGSALVYPYTLSLDDGGHQIDPMCCTVKDASISDRNGTSINGEESDGYEPTSGPLPLSFRHILSRVRVQVKLDATYPNIDAWLNYLRLNDVYSYGSYTVANDLASGSWGSWGSQKDFELYPLTTGQEEGTTKDIHLNAQGTLLCDTLMIPQSVSTNTANFTLQYTHTLAEGGERTVDKTIYLPGNWEPNKIYNYVITISLDVNNITVEANVESMTEEVTPGIDNEPADAVDLGLSVKWASCDFGTMSPYEAAPYFTFTESSLRGTSGVRTLEPSQDRATEWGSKWSTPTQTQWRELMENCTITETTQEGVNGYLVTGTTGKSIFLSGDTYWSSSYYYQYSSYIGYAYRLSTKSYQIYGVNNKYPVRPVYTED